MMSNPGSNPSVFPSFPLYRSTSWRSLSDSICTYPRASQTFHGWRSGGHAGNFALPDQKKGTGRITGISHHFYRDYPECIRRPPHIQNRSLRVIRGRYPDTLPGHTHTFGALPLFEKAGREGLPAGYAMLEVAMGMNQARYPKRAAGIGEKLLKSQTSVLKKCTRS